MHTCSHQKEKKKNQDQSFQMCVQHIKQYFDRTLQLIHTTQNQLQNLSKL